MSNERPEFRPVEIAQRRAVWPFAVMGAVIAGLLIWIARHETGTAQPKQVALASMAPKIEAPAIVDAVKPAGVEPLAQKESSPNVIGSAMNKIAMVAKSELDRELGRTRSAQKQAEAYRKQIASLEKELTDARSQMAAIQKAKAPPPPSDQEQILQMLAPVLRTSNDGRP